MSTAEKTVYTYHCLCTQLVLAGTSPINTLKKRATDSSLILPLPDASSSSHYATLVNTTADQKATVIRREDGFEKRYSHKCARCDLTLAYSLDKSLYEDTKSLTGAREDVVYLLPGGLLDTDDMVKAKDMESEITKFGVKAA